MRKKLELSNFYIYFKEHKKSIADYEAHIQELEECLTRDESELETMNKHFTIRFAVLDNKIQNYKGIAPADDETYNKLSNQITEAGRGIGEPVSEQLQKIEDAKTEKQTTLDELNNTLAQADRMAKDKARIAELEASEKDLAQKIADVEKELADIADYTTKVCERVEVAVNGKFKHVEFKLFNELINGSTEECCDATLNGVPYSDLSSGQRILVGIDIVNVLAEHYDVSVPLFIDHAESMTLPIEAESQTIELEAKDSYTEYQPQPDGSIKEIYHDYTKLTVEIKERQVT